MTLIGTIFLIASTTSADPQISDVFQKNFKDASFGGTIEQVNQSELVKIKKDFGNNYRVKDTKVQLKEPHMLRFQAKVQDTDVLYIINGTRRLAKIPRAGINSKDNFDRAPGKRQTLLDFGILTASMFEDPFSAKYVRTDRQNGDYVFDLTFKTSYNDTSRHRVWVDPEKKFTTKREWYGQNGRFLATFLYEEPVSQNGVWFPTKISVKNVEGKLGGVTKYKNVVINAGIPSSTFEIK